ncbi:MAG: hypothetical protein ACK5LS_14110 [Propioniciclava sp.]
MTYPSPDPYRRRPVDIGAYAPPRRRPDVLWSVVLGAIAVGALIAALVLQPWNRPAAPAPTPAASGSTTLQGLPFTQPDDPATRGRWGIVSQEWQSDTLVLEVWVESDSGDVSFSFMAFNNEESYVYEPLFSEGPRPWLEPGYLQPGERAEGYFLIPMTPGAGSLILTTIDGDQISALPIEP